VRSPSTRGSDAEPIASNTFGDSPAIAPRTTIAPREICTTPANDVGLSSIGRPRAASSMSPRAPTGAADSVPLPSRSNSAASVAHA
jgi:hypothetical protein